MIGGVAGGLADYFGVDPVVVRLFFVLGMFFGLGLAFLVYLVLWVVMPAAPEVHPSTRAAAAAGPAGRDRVGSTATMIGVVLIAGGLLLVINEFTAVRLLGWHMMRLTWPVLLIAVGAAILLLRRDRR